MKILIIKLGARGDVLRTTSILPALSSLYPGSEIYWVANKSSRQVLADNPFLKKVYLAEEPGELFYGKDYDLILNLDEDPAASRIAAAFSCKKKGFYEEEGRILATPSFDYWWRMGVCGPRPDNDRLKKENLYSYQEIIYKALDLKGNMHRPVFNISKNDREWARDFLGKNKKTVGFNFSSSKFWPSKRLSPLKTLKLAEVLESKGWTPLIFGAADEENEIKWLRQKLNHSLFAVNLPVKKFGALIKECGLIITTDSFALHLGASAGAYVVALFGPTSAAEAEIYKQGAKITAPVRCLCCYKKKCNKKPYCMDILNNDFIIDAAEKFKEKLPGNGKVKFK